MYFAEKDGGAIGPVAEALFLGGFAVKKADNTISSVGILLIDGYTNEELLNLKAVAIALGDYSSSDGADIRNPDTVREIMFQYNGIEGAPEIIEITKEQFYTLE